MPIITAKYAPPSIMACANASLTVESQHVSVGSNSFAALSHSEINLPPSRHLYTCPKQKGTHIPVLIGLCMLKTQSEGPFLKDKHKILHLNDMFNWWF